VNKKQVIREYFSSLGKKGGSKGGRARTDAMTPEERTELARMAARARWAKKKTVAKKRSGPTNK
jgi:hypothetical protein